LAAPSSTPSAGQRDSRAREATRGPRLTDHAAVSVSLRADAMALLETGDPTLDDEATLF